MLRTTNPRDFLLALERCISGSVRRRWRTDSGKTLIFIAVFLLTNSGTKQYKTFTYLRKDPSRFLRVAFEVDFEQEPEQEPLRPSRPNYSSGQLEPLEPLELLEPLEPLKSWESWEPWEPWEPLEP